MTLASPMIRASSAKAAELSENTAASSKDNRELISVAGRHVDARFYPEALLHLTPDSQTKEPLVFRELKVAALAVNRGPGIIIESFDQARSLVVH